MHVNKVALIGIQETQLQQGLEESTITKGWGDENYGFDCVEARGRSRASLLYGISLTSPLQNQSNLDSFS